MARLTDEERQEILRLIEAGESLPDEYRHLLFEEKREPELVWAGKSREVCTDVLPFRTVERAGAAKHDDWTNKLIQGDNRLILSSLVNGPMRDEIECHGGIKLIYIDPPFDVGADVVMNIEIGDDAGSGKPRTVEAVAYRDSWGQGADSYIAMMHERLVLMRDLLADDGTIYVHAGSQVSSHLRLLMDEVFGPDRFLNEITWQRFGAHNDAGRFGNVTETIWFYAKSGRHAFEAPRVPLSDAYIAERFIKEPETGRLFYPHTFTGKGPGPARLFRGKSLEPPKGRHWAQTQENIDRLEAENRLYYTANGTPYLKSYLDEQAGRPVQNIWTDIKMTKSGDERLGFPTQKPEALLERIIAASSREGDIVADFFCGSGTTAAVAQKMGRKWICTDLGNLAIHTARKRMIASQSACRGENNIGGVFEILSVASPDRLAAANSETGRHVERILQAYGARKVGDCQNIQGERDGRLVAVSRIDRPVSRRWMEEIILECHRRAVPAVDMLGFEFDTDGTAGLLREARDMGIDVAAVYVPPEVLEDGPADSNRPVFRDVHFVEIRPVVLGKRVSVELTGFEVFGTSGVADCAKTPPGGKRTQVVIDGGHLVRLTRKKDASIARETMTRHWTDWIDYWSVDFDFGGGGAYADDHIFQNGWQSFRTRKDRSLELVSPARECRPGPRKVAAKVVDIFGNDATAVVEVMVGTDA